MKYLLLILLFFTACTSPKKGKTVCESLVLQRSYILANYSNPSVSLPITDSLIKKYCDCQSQEFKK